jgi:hypothetical protein
VTKGLIGLTPEFECDQTAIGLPPVKSVVFLSKSFSKTWMARRNIPDVLATPSGIRRQYAIIIGNIKKLYKKVT